jgi:hypothetical protein
MATATARKASASAAPPLPVTFDEINRRKVRERLEAYRDIVNRHAGGEPVTVADMEKAGELLELLGLPQYCFERDCEAVLRDKASRDKLAAAMQAQPEAIKRAADLAAEIEVLTKKLPAVREEHRRASAAINKPAGYEQSLRQMAAEHPHLFADLEAAASLRIEELDRRKRIGGAA